MGLGEELPVWRGGKWIWLGEGLLVGRFLMEN